VKVALAQFIFESNTFNPVEAGLELFTRGGTWLTEPATVRDWCKGTDSQMAGSLTVLEAAGCATQPAWVAMCGTPAGRLSAECFRTIRATLAGSLRAAMPADAILLHLHGAVCAVGEDDVEGNLLEMVRRELGFTGRLVVSLDLHANVTRRMLSHADAVTAYRTMPHVDFRATGERAAGLVLKAGGTVRTLAKIAALIPPTDTNHAAGHFANILQRARQIEAQPGVLDVSVFPVQPWMDIGEMGTSVVITSEPGAGAEAALTAFTLAESWYAQRRSWRTGVRSWNEIRATLRTRAKRPWMLVDSADATSGGSSGESAEAIQQLWDLRNDLPGEVFLWVVDAEACAAAAKGARQFRLGLQRFAVEADVIHTGEGSYRARGRAYTGQQFSMGSAVVLRAGQLRIVVSSCGALGADPAFYECLGLHPATALAVHVKSLMGWRAGYDATEAQGLIFDGPGNTALSFAQLAYTGKRRELFPISDSPAKPVSVWQSN
jgi:microcystin degradation protein MlrC